MKRLFEIYIVYIFLFRPFYKVRNQENRVNVFVLALVTLLLNTISIITFLTQYFGLKLDLIDLQTPLSVYAFILGPLIFGLYIYIASFIEKKVGLNEKRVIFRKHIENRIPFLVAILYIVVTLSFFGWTMIKVMASN